MGDGNYSIIARQSMDGGELDALRELEESCNRFEGLKLRLNWGVITARLREETSDFLCHDGNGALVGYMGAYGYGRHEIELTGMVHPEHRRRGIFSRLLKTAMREYKEKGAADFMIFNDRASDSGAAFVKSLGASADHSEYRMELREIRPAGGDKTRIAAEEAGPGDIPALAHIDAICFGMPEEETIKLYGSSGLGKNERTYKAVLDGRVIGMFRLHDDGRDTLIFGLGILPEYRGKGLGRELLDIAVRKSLERRPEKVALEVACENEIALSLYRSCGFGIVATYDYFKLRK
jgi:ribosomal protein S18 acetylase RimI-like enzyme